MSTDRRDVLRTPCGPAGTYTYTGTAGTGAVMPPGATSVMCWSTTDAYHSVTDDGTVATTANSTPVPAYIPFWLPLHTQSGAPNKLTSIQVASGGTTYYKPFM